CVRLKQWTLSRKAQFEDGPRALPPGTVSVMATVKEILLGLTDAEWEFAQDLDGKWVELP
ncbi:MAG: hypothetical protein ABIS27_07270, partial [Longimicrobiales bacterium]